MSRVRKGFALTVAALGLLTTLSAEARAQTRGCADDAAKFCPGVTREKGALLACLKPHAAELSAGCRATIERIEQKRGSMVRRRPQVRTARSALRTPSPVPSTDPSPAVSAATPIAAPAQIPITAPAATPIAAPAATP